MNTAVCEDNADERAAICAYMKAYCEQNCFEGELHGFESGEALLSAFAPGAFDLVFLDIYMPGLSGVDVAKKIRETDLDCALVFTTVSDAYTREAFGVQASGYVVKPIAGENMEKTLHFCRELFRRNGRVLEVKSEYQTVRVPARLILYAEVYDKYTPLDEIEEKLGLPFLRCHRSYLVNMRYIQDARAESFLMQNGESVPLRQKNRNKLKMAFGRYRMEMAFAQ